jgi:Nucleotidyl transferase AbiEii toxin, Type IV TA system
MNKLQSQVTSITQKLILISRNLNTPYHNILTSFLLERLAYRLVSDSVLKNQLIFKGGYVGLRVHASPRYTIDLDAVFHRGSFEKLLERAKNAAESNLKDGTWFRYDSQKALVTQGEYGGIGVVFRGGLGDIPKNVKKAQILSFDIGFGDPVTPAPIEMPLPSLLKESTELVWKIYPLETTAAEKIHTLLARSDNNSRSKDIFDLWLFLPQCNQKLLKEAIQSTFAYRKTVIPSDWGAVKNEIAVTFLKQGWNTATSSIETTQRPTFEEAFEKIFQYLITL